MKQNYEGLIGALTDIEARLNYYATNHTPEHLRQLLNSAATSVSHSIKLLRLLNSQSAAGGH